MSRYFSGDVCFASDAKRIVDLSPDHDFQVRTNPLINGINGTRIDLSFTNNDELILSFDQYPSCDDTTQSNNYSVLLIDPTSRKITKKVQFPAISGDARTFVAHDGTTLVLNGETLTKLASSNLRPIRELKLQSLDPDDADPTFGYSPIDHPTCSFYPLRASMNTDKTRILIQQSYSKQSMAVKYVWLDTNSFVEETHLLGRWSAEFYSADDQFLARSGRSTWTIVGQEQGSAVCKDCFYARFVTNQLIAAISAKRLSLIKTDGKIVNSNSFSGILDNIAVASKAKRFVIVTSHGGGPLQPSPYFNVRLFDSETLKEVAQWKYHPPKRDLDDQGIPTALGISPDGNSVAFLAGRRIAIWSVLGK